MDLVFSVCGSVSCGLPSTEFVATGAVFFLVSKMLSRLLLSAVDAGLVFCFLFVVLLGGGSGLDSPCSGLSSSTVLFDFLVCWLGLGGGFGFWTRMGDCVPIIVYTYGF